MAEIVNIDTERRQYVISTESGTSACGFTYLYEQSLELARRLGLPASSVLPAGSKEAYDQAQKLIKEYASSGLSRSTFYSYRTPDAVRAVFEAIYKSGAHQKIRVWCGNIGDGTPWLGEQDVLGYLGRSYGPLRVPLLLPITSANTGYGHAILTDCVLRVVRASRSPELLYQAHNWKCPRLEIKPRAKEEDSAVEHKLRDFSHCVHDEKGELVARFKSLRLAREYVDFQTGVSLRQPKG